MIKSLLNLAKPLFLFAFLFVPIGVGAADEKPFELAEFPLFLSQPSPSNLMYILDDSGSMLFELMPENLFPKIDGSADKKLPAIDVSFLFPHDMSRFSTEDSTIRADFTAAPGAEDNVMGKVIRSQINTLYYNPAVRYKPWIKADGSLMDDAPPTCAPHNPMNRTQVTNLDNTSCRDFTRAETINTGPSRGDNNSGMPLGTLRNIAKCTSQYACRAIAANTNVVFFQPTYYVYNKVSSEIYSNNNFTEVIIASGRGQFTGHGRTKETRDDCAEVSGVWSCTYDKEIQNYANWYTYYRSRLLTSRAGTGYAFQPQSSNIRVGFAAINKQPSENVPVKTIDGISGLYAVVRGVRTFSSEEKESFFRELYERPIAAQITPLRTALAGAGEYFKNTTNKGPWGDNPGLDNRENTDEILKTHSSCRASSIILMTDGYWNDKTIDTGFPALFRPANRDGNEGAPFADDWSNTLADVAMNYWDTDLNTVLDNNVPKILRSDGSVVDDNTKQHLNIHTVGLGVSSSLNIEFDVDTVLKNKKLLDKVTGDALSWPQITVADEGNESAKKIDDLFHAAVNGRGSFFNARKPAEFQAGLTKILENLSAGNYSGTAAAANSSSLNDGSFLYQASFSARDWSGLVRATPLSGGGELQKIGGWVSTIPEASSRIIWTMNDTSGVAFSRGNLSPAQQAMLGANTAEQEARIKWFYGENGLTSPADLRVRTSKLGDIVNSDPVFAGKLRYNHELLSSKLGGDKYKQWFTDIKSKRRDMVYVGANDGMLHGFNADANKSGILGREVFAYIPKTIYSKLKKITQTPYAHTMTVDGPVSVGDAYIQGSWRNLLVGSFGAGARGLYVLDVTDPDTFTGSNVLFEINEAKYPQLGSIRGPAFIAPGSDDRWKIFVAAGYNSTQSNKAQAMLAVIDIEDEINKLKADDPKNNTKFISTHKAADVAANEYKNGLSAPAYLADASGRIITAYAGDLLGNMWKFDLSSTDRSKWVAPYILYAAGNKQPITASPILGPNSLITPAAVMVYFGTGKYLSLSDISNNETQSFYAIADRGKGTAKSKLSKKEFTEIQEDGVKRRTISGEVKTTESGLASAVDWTTKDGWYMDFSAAERVITKPHLLYDHLIFNTFIPSSSSCMGGGSGWLMELIGVGDRNLSYKLLEDQGNIYSEGGATLGRSTVLVGTKGGSNASSASSSSAGAGSGCSGGKVAIIESKSDTSMTSTLGNKECGISDRQSWRELRN